MVCPHVAVFSAVWKPAASPAATAMVEPGDGVFAMSDALYSYFLPISTCHFYSLQNDNGIKWHRESQVSSKQVHTLESKRLRASIMM